MPHECTDCGAVYEDGSTQMLEGCEDCGGTTFIFTKTKPPATEEAAEPVGADAGSGPGDADAGSDEDAAQSRARSDVAEPDDGPKSETPEEPDAPDRGGPDDDPDARADDATAPASVHADGVDRSPDSTADRARHPSASSGDSGDGELITPEVDEIREELMAQFESIKIVEPGSYELNLMNLYDRDEKIIALQEDGRYQVSLPSAFDD